MPPIHHLKKGISRMPVTALMLTATWAATTGLTGAQPSSEAAEPAKDPALIPQPQKEVKSDAEWKTQLTREQYRVLRQKGTERAFTGKYWDKKEAGVYSCAGCGLPLFGSQEKFDAGCGWPSFGAPTSKTHVAIVPDHSDGMERNEVQCSRCGGHLGHVFDDGPRPTGLRYCINSAALAFRKEDARPKQAAPELRKATFGAGCFWCTQAVFQTLKGVNSVSVGYAGGHTPSPDYRAVCAGTTGHAEVAEVVYDPKQVSYDELLDLFWEIHDPTSLNKQGGDSGTQYRSAIFYHTEEQKERALKAKAAHQARLAQPIVTEITPAGAFYPAETYHQDYFRKNPNAGYCQMVIAPKLKKVKQQMRQAP